jgi:ubiquinone biosynthesis protein
VEGTPLSAPGVLDRPEANRSTLATHLTRGFLASALDHGLFHADMHEGNMILGPDGALWLVDFGIMGRIGPPERRYLAEILWGFLQRDYDRIAEVHFEAGYVPAHQSVAAFADALRAVGEPIWNRPAAEVSMGRVLMQLFDFTELFEMKLRPELVLLQKTMVQVEGVARSIDPNHHIWTAARPVVERWIRRELGPGARVKGAFEHLRAGLEGLAERVRGRGQTP